MTGGTGNDFYYVDDEDDQVIEADGGGTDTVYATVSYSLDAAQRVETLRVAGAADIILTGNDFTLKLLGSTGNDTLIGGAGNNRLVGSGGNDRLSGGAGTDTLTGGAGADAFVVNGPADGVDRITDFTPGTDFMEILGAAFNDQLVAGVTPTLITAASNTAANSGAQPYFIYDNFGANAGTLYCDANGGSGADAVAIAILTGTPVLAATDLHITG
jgi:Ca2+-binding RTX toxin-like protein